MRNQPLLTIIIPVYGVEKYLDQCVESVVNQTYQNLQIILVDDKSPDSCPAICDKWAKQDSRIEVIHKDKNEGLGLARNTGLGIAKGNYIAFLDSDDYVDTTMYDILMQCALENSADIVFCGSNRQQPDGTFRPDNICSIEPLVKEGNMSERVLDYLPCTTSPGHTCAVWCAVYKREIAMIPFKSERTYISEDAIWTADVILKAHRIIHLPQALHYYRYNSNSISRTYKSGEYNRVILTAKVLQEILSPVGLTKAHAHYLLIQVMLLFRNHVFGHGLGYNQIQKLYKDLYKNTDFQKIIKQAGLSYNKLKDKLLYKISANGTPTSGHLYGWIEKYVICQKLGLNKLFKR